MHVIFIIIRFGKKTKETKSEGIYEKKTKISENNKSKAKGKKITEKDINCPM